MRFHGIALASCLAVASCSSIEKNPTDALGTTDVNLDSKADSLGNRRYDSFGGVLHFDDSAHRTEINGYGYRVAYTLRAKAGLEFKLSAMGADDPDFDTVIGLYGPRNSAGNYPLVTTNDDFGGSLMSVIYHKPRREGIYLVLVTAYGKGVANVHLNCGNMAECELGCVVTRLWNPVCGADGHTYGNPGEAACFAVPIDHAGVCEPVAPSCDDVTCGDGEHCELQEVQCITTPCYPQPTCVANLNACAVVRCASGTACEVQPDGSAACVPQSAGGCFRTGCSGQICADESRITTCEFRPEYACYQQAECKRQADGNCGYTQTAALSACLANP